jgi:membrane-anchored mycosin MYCP
MAAAVLLAATALAPVLSPAAPAAAADCVRPGNVVSTIPWVQERYSFPQVWTTSTGGGVLVAVVASGVDVTQARLAGRVFAGRDFRKGAKGAAGVDCTGLGTQVAGVIAARRPADTGFAGVAPDAYILALGASGTENVDQDTGDLAGSPAAVANAIKEAVVRHASVIVVPVVTHVDSPALRAAVGFAEAHDVVVIAAVGAAPDNGDPTPYPAAYDGVVGVGAVDDQGVLAKDSQVGKYVDLVGPGAGILVSTQARGGLTTVKGTGIAAGYVAGVAALVRSRWPQLTAIDVVQRMQGTATPASQGPGTPGYGSGLVNPVQAAAETMAGSVVPRRPADFVAPTPDPASVRQAAADTGSRNLALLIAAVATAVGLLIVLFAVAIPRGRRRRWKPGMAAPVPENPEAEVPAPPVGLFEER